jgi:Tfp pilus assembly protein PilX
MKSIKNEQGVALLLVIMALLIFSLAVVAIYSGFRTQGNISSMATNSEVALNKAEDGLTIAINNLKAGYTVNGKSYTTTDGWKIEITDRSSNSPRVLEAKATKGRYSRTVALNIVVTPLSGGGPGDAINHEVFTAGDFKWKC